MKKVYISGQISGLDFGATKEVFLKKQKELEALGYEVINPTQFKPHGKDYPSWSDHMRLDIKMLMDCDCICMLDGWHESRGAVIELYLAKQLNMEVLD